MTSRRWTAKPGIRLLAMVAAMPALVPALVPAAGPAMAATARPPAPRCGWVVNPTPANWWLTDRDGEWTMAVQGGFQARGLDDVPDLTESQWVVTNGSSYGYGCACMTADVDKGAKRITRIRNFRQKPLALCRADRRLKRPE